MKPIRILLADDHALVRSGIRALLDGFGGFEFVPDANNGREAVERTEKHQPDVVLMDIAMPELNGLDATARIVAKSPATRVIMLSMNSDREYVLQAMRAGASGYLLKNVSPAELQQGIHAVMRGETYLSSAVTGHLVSGLLGGASEKSGGSVELTPRQREVLQLIAEGFTTKEIAAKLGISVKTAETHRTQLMDALDIHEIAGLVRYAIRTGLITPD